MTCQDTQTLLHGYVDSELDVLRSTEIEQHLAECPGCAQAYARLQELRSALKGGVPYFQAPPHLERRVRAALRQATRSRPAIPALLPRLVGVAAVALVTAITTWSLVRLWSAPATHDFLTRQLVASHVRAQMPFPGHRFDVESSDQHVVKPWFEGKLDFAPSVKDLTSQGFPLIGGRVDYLDNRPVAALVYQRRKHVINLYTWPSRPGGEATAQTETRQGFHLIHWTQAGMTYWAVSDLNVAELQEFVRLIQEPPG